MRDDDGGITWSAVLDEKNLVDPNCQASIVGFTSKDNLAKNLVRFEEMQLFSNPANTERTTMTVRISYDQCRTWKVSKMLHCGPAAYSDLAVTSDTTVCCLYERGNIHRRESIRLAQFNLAWLTS